MAVLVMMACKDGILMTICCYATQQLVHQGRPSQNEPGGGGGIGKGWAEVEGNLVCCQNIQEKWGEGLTTSLPLGKQQFDCCPTKDLILLLNTLLKSLFMSYFWFMCPTRVLDLSPKWLSNLNYSMTLITKISRRSVIHPSRWVIFYQCQSITKTEKHKNTVCYSAATIGDCSDNTSCDHY